MIIIIQFTAFYRISNYNSFMKYKNVNLRIRSENVLSWPLEYLRDLQKKMYTLFLRSENNLFSDTCLKKKNEITAHRLFSKLKIKNLL